MKKTSLSRRTFLRGMLAGGAVSVGLPMMEIFLNSHGTAYADGSAFPLRFVNFQFGNGVHPEKWIPATTGNEWELPDLVKPFENVRSKISMITGMEVKLPNLLAHGSGPAGFLSGAPLLAYNDDDFTFTQPSIDQLLAAGIGGETQYRSLQLGAEPGCRGLSYNGPDSMNPPESDPRAFFDRLFGDGFRAPGDEPIIDPKLSLRRSVLDAVTGDIAKLKTRLGQGDLWRLDQHLSAVRDLELRLARMEDDPPNLASCDRPVRPSALRDIDGRPQMSARAEAMSEMASMALACDLTRVMTYTFCDKLSDTLYPGMSTGHHQLTHDEPGDMPQVYEIETIIMAACAQFLEQMDSVAEGSETLLDHSAVLVNTDVSYARTHAIDEFPILLAGGANGKLNTGYHYRSSTKESTSHVIFSLLRTMGLSLSEWGVDECLVNDGLGVMEV